jgi:transposase
VGATLDTSDDVSRRSRKGRANYAADFKAQIVAQASAPGVSVAKVAQRHQLNTNMVFRWMREAEGFRSPSARPKLVEIVPVPSAVEATALPVPVTPAAPPMESRPSALVEVVFPAAVVRIQGEASQSLLRSVFSALAKIA